MVISDNRSDVSLRNYNWYLSTKLLLDFSEEALKWHKWSWLWFHFTDFHSVHYRLLFVVCESVVNFTFSWRYYYYYILVARRGRRSWCSSKSCPFQPRPSSGTNIFLSLGIWQIYFVRFHECFKAGQLDAVKIKVDRGRRFSLLLKLLYLLPKKNKIRNWNFVNRKERERDFNETSFRSVCCCKI